MRSRPEHDGTDGVESETHEDSDLVALALEHLSSDRREEQVTATEVHDLKTSGFEFGDAEDGLEVLVQDIEQTVGEAPEEEERGDEEDGEDELAAGEEAALDRRDVDWDAASHRDGVSVICSELVVVVVVCQRMLCVGRRLAMLREQGIDKLKTLIMNDQVLDGSVAVEGCCCCVMVLVLVVGRSLRSYTNHVGSSRCISQGRSAASRLVWCR